MIRDLFKLYGNFAQRMQKDHLGAYAATCAYFLMISFVPFVMIFVAFASMAHADISLLTDNIISIVPSGLKAYVEAILIEIVEKTYAYVPVSILVLIWSASKVFHALTNGLNVISNVQETRGWLYLRFRSMFFVVLLFVIAGVALLLSIFGNSMRDAIVSVFPAFGDILRFFLSFRVLFGYFGLILMFLYIYKFLPNCHYTFRSQLPGALIVSTVWMFFSYMLSLYYEHNQNFIETYGSMTGMILAMMWLYFCCFFLMVGAELNRVIYEDPDDNFIVNTLETVKDASEKKQQVIEEELNEHSIWRPLDEDEDWMDDDEYSIDDDPDNADVIPIRKIRTDPDAKVNK